MGSVTVSADTIITIAAVITALGVIIFRCGKAPPPIWYNQYCIMKGGGAYV